MYTVQQRSVSEFFVTSKQLMFNDSKLRTLSVSIMRLLLPVRYLSIMQNDPMTGSILLIRLPISWLFIQKSIAKLNYKGSQGGLSNMHLQLGTRALSVVVVS